MDLFVVKDTVKNLLENVPALRDDDNRLILNVWATQNSSLSDNDCSFSYFAYQFKSKNLASTESIRRVRQALQKEFPNLRGKLYEQRHNHQDHVVEQLNQPEFKAGGTP